MSQNELPNGGWLAWSQVLASFLTLICTLGLSNSFGVFQSYYQRHILDSYSPSAIAWIGTMQGFLLSAVGPISGSLYDKGYVKLLMYIGSVLSVAGLLGTSFAEQYPWIFLSYGVCTGLGCGLLFVPALSIIQAYFSGTRAALATAIAMSGSSIGGIIYPILFRQLNDKISFEWTCRVFALMNGVLLLASCIITKPQPTPEGSSSHKSNRRVFRDWRLFLLGSCALLLDVVVDVPFYYIPTFVQDRLGLSPEVGDALLAGMNGSSLLGRLLLNSLTTYFQPVKLWQLTILGSCILLFCWSSIGNLAGIIVYVILYGFLVGGLISLIPPTVRELYPEPSVFGSRLGFIEGFQGLGFLVGPPLAGAILDLPTGYLGVSLLCGSLYFGLFLMVGVFTWRRPVSKSLEDGSIDGAGLPKISHETTTTATTAIPTDGMELDSVSRIRTAE